MEYDKFGTNKDSRFYSRPNGIGRAVGHAGGVGPEEKTKEEDRMAWIEVVDQRDADEKLSRAYGEVAAHLGRVANILKVHSVRPEVMTAHLALYRELMFGRSELTRDERELIAVTVSAANQCDY